MIQEERNTMLVALAPYIPHKVMVEYDYGDGVKRSTEFHGNYYYLLSTGNLQWKDFKPYLRSIDTMTEEEKMELKSQHVEDEKEYCKILKRLEDGDKTANGLAIPYHAVDWCNKNKFDYRGLIEKGLAIEAPKDLYRK